MKRLIIPTVLFFILGLALGQEAITLDSPVQADPGATVFKPSVIHFEVFPDARIIVGFQEFEPGVGFVEDGKHITCTLTGDDALAQIRSLNKLNLSTNTLQKRLMAWGQSRNCLPAGTISGDPE